MPTWAALTAAVLDRPDDDTPRLAAADYLADHGGAAGLALAEPIRLQVDLARLPGLARARGFLPTPGG